MSTKTILVDSNILVYAINSSSPKHEIAQVFLQANVGHMTIAHQNMFESLRVLTHKKFPNPMSPTNAIAAINSIAERCQVIAPESGTQHFALALVKKHKLTGDKIFDAYLAATVLAIGITTIATDNTKDFLPFEGITVFNPFS